MEIYLREGFSEGWGVSLIALDSLAPLGEMTESCGDAVSAVLQRKRRAGTLGGGSPRRPPPRGALCPASQRPHPPPSQARCWARLLSPAAEEERGSEEGISALGKCEIRV